MSLDTLEQYTRLLITAEAARAVSDVEAYRRLRTLAFEVRLSESLSFD